jgi:hypothetical protein
MRNFKTGAIRDKDDNKLDYEAFNCPLVMERYAQYLHKHRIQPDGQVRAGDNWQKLFGDDHENVCMKSAFRHFHSWWKAHRGYESEDIEESICALVFNANAYLHKILKKNYGKTKNDFGGS